MYIKFISLVSLIYLSVLNTYSESSSISFISTSCKSGEWKCKSGQCIPRASFCDGKYDCIDKSDENKDCLNTINKCPSHAYKCAYGACVHGNAECNNVTDCVDGSDEDWSKCRQSCLFIGSDKTSANCGNISTSATVKRIQRDVNTCETPAPIQNGGYFSLNQTTALQTGVSLNQYEVITFKCNRNHELYPNVSISFCDVNGWNPGPPKCLKQCLPITSTSIETKCVFDNINVNCSERMFEGTIVTMKCKNNYISTDLRDSRIIRCISGIWDRVLLQCAPVCGKIIQNEVTNVTGTVAEVPWHIGIYKNETTFVCGGSLLSSNIVLSAAHCFTDYEGKAKSIQMYTVVAGKFYNSRYDERDKNVQFSKIKQISIPKNYRGQLTNYANDIAVVVLEQPFALTSVVQPICVDWNNLHEQNQLIDGNLGFVASWNRNTPVELKKIALSYVDERKCFQETSDKYKAYLTSDKICAESLNGSAICENVGGNGFVFINNLTQQYYIQGIVSTCDFKKIGTFTKVSNFLSLIRKTGDTYLVDAISTSDVQLLTTQAPVLNARCILPPKPRNGIYSKPGLNATLIPGEETEQGTYLSYDCYEGYGLYPLNSNFIRCLKGEWNKPIPNCVKTCLPKISKSVQMTCKLDNSDVNCTEPMLEGTLIRMKCKNFHKRAHHLHNPTTYCANGNFELIKCLPECGKIIQKGNKYVINGESAKEGEFPWHVAIHRKDSDDLKNICGGSLINTKIVLTAAHCFMISYKRKRRDKSDYFIEGGKYYRKSNDTRDIYAQYSTVNQILLHEEYKAELSNYGSDIAIVILEQQFTITHVVQPICIDWENEYEDTQLIPGNQGAVVGWGYTKEGSDPSDDLKVLRVPYIDRGKCFEVVPEDFYMYLTQDKICAGFTNGSSVCEGDSGGGLVFYEPDNKRYYIRGVVSVGPIKSNTCDSRQYAAYTKVSKYMDFISQIEALNRPE